MNALDIPQAGWPLLLLMRAIEWLGPVTHAVGLAMCVWAFIRCRKNGYLVIGFSFLLILLYPLVMPRIHQMVQERRAPALAAQTEEKLAAAIQETIDRVLREEGHTPSSHDANLRIPLGPMCLVLGLWLVARRDVMRPQPEL